MKAIKRGVHRTTHGEHVVLGRVHSFSIETGQEIEHKEVLPRLVRPATYHDLKSAFRLGVM